MSEDLFYNRDYNTTPTGGANVFFTKPRWGSSVQWSSKEIAYETDNKILNTVPLSINNLVATFTLLHDAGTTVTYGTYPLGKDFVGTIEAVGGDQLVKIPFDEDLFSTNMSGYFRGYSVEHRNRTNSIVTSTLEMVDYSPLLAWSGSNNVLNQQWTEYDNSSVAYEEFDIVYTGIDTNKLNNFWYCTGDHTSYAGNSPTGTGSMWTQTFFFSPDEGYEANVSFDVETLDWKNAQTQKMKIKDNTAVFGLSLDMSSRSLKESRAILHYLDNKAGFRRFRYDAGWIYNRPKILYCPEWNITPVYVDVYDISLRLVEDPLGIIATGN